MYGGHAGCCSLFFVRGVRNCSIIALTQRMRNMEYGVCAKIRKQEPGSDQPRVERRHSFIKLKFAEGRYVYTNTSESFGCKQLFRLYACWPAGHVWMYLIVHPTIPPNPPYRVVVCGIDDAVVGQREDLVHYRRVQRLA